MAQEQTAIRERQKTRLKEPGRYVVMMFNDDFTPMDFVVEILESIFFKSQAEAEAIMLKVHHEEKKPWWAPTAMTSPRVKWRKRWRKPVRRSFRLNSLIYMSVLMDDALKQARFFDHEFVMPEHMLLALLRQYAFCQALQEEGVDSLKMHEDLVGWLAKQERVPETIKYLPEPSSLFKTMFGTACALAAAADRQLVNVPPFCAGDVWLAEFRSRLPAV